MPDSVIPYQATIQLIIKFIAFLIYIANSTNGVSSKLNSMVYKWNGSSFVEFQAIPTNGGSAATTLVVDGKTYLSVGNLYNDPQNLIISALSG